MARRNLKLSCSISLLFVCPWLKLTGSSLIFSLLTLKYQWELIIVLGRDLGFLCLLQLFSNNFFFHAEETLFGPSH